jgi:hypothetical protein
MKSRRGNGGENDQEGNPVTTIPSYHGGEPLTLLFRLDDPRQAEALEAFQIAFGPTITTEAVNDNVQALHIWPGHPDHRSNRRTRGCA